MHYRCKQLYTNNQSKFVTSHNNFKKETKQESGNNQNKFLSFSHLQRLMFHYGITPLTFCCGIAPVVLFSDTSRLCDSLMSVLLQHRTHNFVRTLSFLRLAHFDVVVASHPLSYSHTFHCFLASHTSIAFITGLNNNFILYFVTLRLYSFIFFLGCCWCMFSCI